MHRDLKPENVMLDDNLHLKLVSATHLSSLQIDFGDAKQFTEDIYDFNPDPRNSQVLRQTGELHFSRSEMDGFQDSFVGTPLYVSPEMLSDCKTVPGSDLWSLGVILF